MYRKIEEEPPVCATPRRMEDRSCAGNCLITPTRFAQTIFWSAVIVVVFANLTWITHAIERIFFVVGMVVIGAAISWLYLRKYLPARNARAAELAAGWQANAIRTAGQRAVAPVQAQQQPQLDGGGQHLHIHLPAGADIGSVLRGQ